MKLKDYLVSDEIQSSLDAGQQMLSIVKQTSYFWLKQAIAIFVPIAFGYLISQCIISIFILNPTQEQLKGLSNAVSSSMATITVLAGFTVTLMLFTGRTSNTQSLTADTAQTYVDKVTYLLFSQALTLLLHVLSIISCLIWILIQSLQQEQLASPIMLSLTAGLILLSLLRTLLLPLQIYDVHQFELSGMVEEKILEFEASLSSSSNPKNQ